MKRLYLLAAVALSACAPAPAQEGAHAHRYLARSGQVLAAISDSARTLRSSGGERLWTVDSSRRDGVFLRATGAAVSRDPLVLFVVTDTGTTTIVTDSSGSRAELAGRVQAVYDELGRRFTEIR